jgi:hypothetical protein
LISQIRVARKSSLIKHLPEETPPIINRKYKLI